LATDKRLALDKLSRIVRVFMAPEALWTLAYDPTQLDSTGQLSRVELT